MSSQKRKSMDKIAPIAQTKKRVRLAVSPSYEEAVLEMQNSEFEELSIRRIKNGFGVFRRLPIKKEMSKQK